MRARLGGRLPVGGEAAVLFFGTLPGKGSIFCEASASSHRQVVRWKGGGGCGGGNGLHIGCLVLRMPLPNANPDRWEEPRIRAGCRGGELLVREEEKEQEGGNNYQQGSSSSLNSGSDRCSFSLSLFFCFSLPNKESVSSDIAPCHAAGQKVIYNKWSPRIVGDDACLTTTVQPCVCVCAYGCACARDSTPYGFAGYPVGKALQSTP